MRRCEPNEPARPYRRAAYSRLIALLVGAGMFICAGVISPTALMIVLRDGPIAAAIVLAAAGLGLWIMRALGLHEAELRWQLLAGTGLGLGAISLLILGLGVLGILQRGVWIAVLIVCTAGGAWRVRGLVRLLPKGSRGIGVSPVIHCRDGGTTTDRESLWDALLLWLWLAVIGFGGLTLLAGTLPPGILWPAEGNGYDVLEYHLAGPREYLEAARITYLPHNIYSNFPLNVEMLYLLTMVLRGNAVEAAFAAGLLNVFLGALAVAAMWLAGREFGRGGGVVAGVLTASCPFVVYLSGITYVENGLLLFTALAVGTFLHATRMAANLRWPWLTASGLLYGLACGCKYTAVPMVLLPLVLATLWSMIAGRFRPIRARAGARGRADVPPIRARAEASGPTGADHVNRLRMAFWFLAGCVLTFGPWLAKNAVMTGNPVFPLGGTIFVERAGVWDEDGARRWDEGHLPAPEDRPLARRMQRLWQEVMGTGLFARAANAQPAGQHMEPPINGALFGPAIGVALLAGFVAATRSFRRASGATVGAIDPETTTESPLPEPNAAVCWLMLIVGIVVWLAFTHLEGRFAITLIVPAGLVLARAWSRVRASAVRLCGVAALLVIVAVNLNTTLDLFRSTKVLDVCDLRDQQRTDGLAWFTDGQWPWQAHVPRLNALADEGARILMIADARRFYLHRGVDYCVVFNRNPFAEAAARLSASELLDWLRDHGYGYVYVDWIEMHRLRASRYGFWPSLDEALFSRLLATSLVKVQDFTFPDEPRIYGTLFAVPPARPQSK